MNSIALLIQLQVLGQYLIGDDPMKDFKKLKRLLATGKGDLSAAVYISVWTPFEDYTVTDLVELIEADTKDFTHFTAKVIDISRIEKPIEIVIVPSSEDQRAYEKVKTTKSAASLSKRRKDSANRFIFNTSAEADAFIKGYTSTIGYLGDEMYFDSRNK